MHTITCAIVYWTDRVSFSFVYMCVNQHTCAKLLICVVYLEISPAESPPTDNCIFFLRTVIFFLITAILENSSFLAKTLGVGPGLSDFFCFVANRPKIIPNQY